MRLTAIPSHSLTEHSFLEMFIAYFDASRRDKELLTMAGFVSRVYKWRRFEGAWRALLPSGITSFHMTDFASHKKGWEPWKGKAEWRAQFVADLIDCIKANTNKGFAVSLLLKNYHSVNARYKLGETIAGGPYRLVGEACLGELRKWAERKRNHIDYRKIRCIFEDGDPGQGHLIKRACSLGWNATSQNKQYTRAFDACDLAAWKTRALYDDSLIRHLHFKNEGNAERLLRTLDQLNSILQSNRDLDIPVLDKMCASLGVEKRSASDNRVMKNERARRKPLNRFE
jgi:hypothetical protein